MEVVPETLSVMARSAWRMLLSLAGRDTPGRPRGSQRNRPGGHALPSRTTSRIWTGAEDRTLPMCSIHLIGISSGSGWWSCMVTGATFGLLMLEDMFGGVRKLLQVWGQLRPDQLLLPILAPSLLKMVLPVSILISLLYSLGHLHRNNEFTAHAFGGYGDVADDALDLGRGVPAVGSVVFPSGRRDPVVGRAVAAIYGTTCSLPTRQKHRTSSRSAWFMVWPSITSATTGSGSEPFQRIQLPGLRASPCRRWTNQRREVRRIMATEGFFDDVDQNWVFI